MNTIRQLRREAKLTQEELGKKIGKSNTYIADIENGIRKIEGIAAGTLVKIAEALDTTVDDLMNPADSINDNDFEWEDDKLIVDKLFFCASANKMAIEVDGLYFILTKHTVVPNEPLSRQLKPLKKTIEFRAPNAGVRICKLDFEYLMAGCVPRKGYNIKIGRKIEQEEFDEICEKYHISKDKISGKYVTSIGGALGRRYVKEYTCVQVRVDEWNAIHLENELEEKGIEAGNIASGIVKIRVE
ncbi:MAG: helix-turn-helix transcriptional regulator [Clostridia bacterium]|nr:helix-turn-helix transcriptional regulator [Clostridia bacterium]